MVTRKMRKILQEAGAKGGRARARKHSKKQIRIWSSAGGRPQTTRLIVLNCVKDGLQSRQAIADKTGLDLLVISASLSRLKRTGHIQMQDRNLYTIRKGRNDGTKSKTANQNGQSLTDRKVRPATAAD